MTTQSGQTPVFIPGTSVVATIIPPGIRQVQTADTGTSSSVSVSTPNTTAPLTSSVPVSTLQETLSTSTASSLTPTQAGGAQSLGVPLVVNMGQLPPANMLQWLPAVSSSTAGSVVGISMPSETGVQWLPAVNTSAAGSGVVTPSVADMQWASAGVLGGLTTPQVHTAQGMTARVPAGAYMAEGLLPVPEKLMNKIIRFEFIEMRELMPETWVMEEEEATKGVLGWPRRKSKPVTDILQWLSCFAVMVSVLSKPYPQMVPELMAYQATIIRCARDFDGIAWVLYDRSYRRQAAQSKDWHWSRLNTTLYSLCFAGKAKRQVVCHHCLSDNHPSGQCPENVSRGLVWQQVQPATHLQTQADPAPAFTRPAGVRRPSAQSSAAVCYLFNARGGSKCSYKPCKYAHACSLCKGPHPRGECSTNRRAGEFDIGSEGGRGGPGAKRPRLD